MDHETVDREKMTEKYLLHELDPGVRDEFEEHFFDCPQCAFDVSAAAEFIEQSKTVLAEKPEETPAPAPTPEPAPSWLARLRATLRPAIAVPVMALLLAVIGYQNLVTLPQLAAKASHPQVLAWASVNVGTWGANAPVIKVHQGEGFLLFVRIPPDAAYTRYTADLYDPAGKLEWSLTIPAAESQDQWPVQVPGASREAGNYALAVKGVTAAGESKEVGRTSFELQIQK